VGSEAGVLHAVQLLRSEIDRNLAMLGIDQVSAIDRSILSYTAADPAV
jgi:L-lactate dehydrogenase (cytochrome)